MRYFEAIETTLKGGKHVYRFVEVPGVSRAAAERARRKANELCLNFERRPDVIGTRTFQCDADARKRLTGRA